MPETRQSPASAAPQPPAPDQWLKRLDTIVRAVILIVGLLKDPAMQPYLAPLTAACERAWSESTNTLRALVTAAHFDRLLRCNPLTCLICLSALVLLLSTVHGFLRWFRTNSRFHLYCLGLSSGWLLLYSTYLLVRLGSDDDSKLWAPGVIVISDLLYALCGVMISGVATSLLTPLQSRWRRAMYLSNVAMVAMAIHGRSGVLEDGYLLSATAAVWMVVLTLIVRSRAHTKRRRVLATIVCVYGPVMVLRVAFPWVCEHIALGSLVFFTSLFVLKAALWSVTNDLDAGHDAHGSDARRALPVTTVPTSMIDLERTYVMAAARQ